jgi:two-component system, LytTR family, sensor kinase
MQGMFENRSQLAWYWAFWALMAVYNASYDTFWAKEPFWQLLPINFLQIVVWGLSGLAVIALAKRFPIEKLDWSEWGRITLHLGFCLLLTAVGLFMMWMLWVVFKTHRIPFSDPSDPTRLIRLYLSFSHVNFLLMVAVLASHHMLLAHRKFRQREVKSTQLESRFIEAQNQALRMQLQPHFLFNVLHSISTLIHSDPETADRMIARLGDLLRLSLDQSGQQEVSLAQEVAFLEHYLAIEKVQERLNVSFDIPEPLKEARVPSFLLQPLVENAIKHGILGHRDGGRVQVRARQDEGQLCLEVEDDGIGSRPLHSNGQGIGTTNTRQRLELLFGTHQSFDLEMGEGSGTLARIRMPLSFGHWAPATGGLG